MVSFVFDRVHISKKKWFISVNRKKHISKKKGIISVKCILLILIILVIVETHFGKTDLLISINAISVRSFLLIRPFSVCFHIGKFGMVGMVNLTN